MDLYEYQGKELFRRVGIPVSDGRLATTPGEARAAAEVLGGPVVVKAQVLTGGRGKAGGVKLAATPDEAEARAKNILGLDIKGHVVKRLWIEQASDIAKEYYLSLTFDRGVKQPLFMFTTQGGVEIEQVAEENPGCPRPPPRRPARGLQPLAGAPARLRRRRHRSVRAEADRQDHRPALRRIRPLRRDALRGKPADRDARRRRQGARLEVHRRRQRALPPPGRSPRCATRMPPTRSRRSPARSTSPTSSSTARSASAATAPG